ncbi:hypothetical protein [Plasmodium yoelii yoelii]|uniref:Uncharacterized protein n=1 Tax=Plasmodium yoelii yoelii TaxID=73239 RepID=Q7RPD7_PLAYO|nr:hypothetical protein [Plasmodium yoelii yoelii]
MKLGFYGKGAVENVIKFDWDKILISKQIEWKCFGGKLQILSKRVSFVI